MGDGVVEALSLQLLLVHVPAPLDTLRIGLPKGQMAGGVLIKQGVVEQDVLVSDGTVIGDQGHLPEVGGTLVHRHCVAEGLLPLLGVDLHDLPLLHLHPELIHDIAVVAQGQGGVHHAVDPLPEGGSEDLLGGHVGNEVLALGGGAVAGSPQVVLRQLDGEIGPQAVPVVEGTEMEVIQLLFALLQHAEMGPPLLHCRAVAGDPNRRKNGAPKPLHSVRLAGKHLFRPAGDGDGGDAPGEGILHLQPVEGLEGLAAGLLAADDAAGVHPLQILRVAGGDGEIGGALLGVVVVKVLIPRRHGVKHVLGGVEVLLPGQRIVSPAHNDLPASGGIGRLGTQPGEVGTLHRAGDHQVLPRLDIDADLHQEPGIFL